MLIAGTNKINLHRKKECYALKQLGGMEIAMLNRIHVILLIQGDP